jgi:trehalose 6-phosphate synthase/phosphatase
VFNVTAASAIGETICVSGDHPLLGAWEERDALELVTTPEYYPTWYSLEPVNLPLGQTITYKYFIKSGGQFSRWESEEGDRMLTPRGRDMVVNEEIKTSTEVAASAAPPWSSSSSSASASASSTASNTQLPSSHSSQSFGSAPSSFSNSVPLPLTQLHPDPTGSRKTMEQEATTAHQTTLDPAAPNTTNATTTTQTTPPLTSRTNHRVIISPNFVPPRSPSSPVRSSPNLSSLSPRTSNGSDTNSEFEELQLDGRDAVIIASVFLPVRVRRGEAPSETTATATAATKAEHSPPMPPWHIEWDDSALLARPALFARKLHVDQDDHKMSYVGLVPMEGDAEELTLEEQDDLRRQLEPFRCTPIFLKKSQRLAFYEGFCHKALWKMVHNWVDIYGLHTTRWWDEDEHINQYQSYLAVNAIFAQAIVEEYSEGDMIWVNGHELCLVSSYVLRKATTATIGIFIHSPFPSSEIFRTLSVREDILRGMLNCDQIGFQSYEYARHFLTCCRRVLDLKDHTERQGFSVVRYQGRDVRITVAHANIESRLGTKTTVDSGGGALACFVVHSPFCMWIFCVLVFVCFCTSFVLTSHF